MTAGRDTYEAERARLLKRQARRAPADPQRTPAVWRDPRKVVAALMRPCGCGHREVVHEMNKAETKRAECTIIDGTAGKCRCTKFHLDRDGVDV